jgi:5-methylcytosine-specific restriction endonuclease McrA
MPDAPTIFRFDPSARRPYITNNQVLHGLRRFARNRKGRLLKSNFQRWKSRPFSSNLPSKRFGSWSAALLAAGLDRAARTRRTPGELMDLLEKLWQELGYPPTGNDLARLRTTESAFRRHWGTYMNARRLLADYKEGRITRDQLLTPTPDRSNRRPIPPALRLRVLMRDGQRCVICGQGAKEGAVLEVDHIVPVCKGGGDGMENLRTLCRACNRGKGKEAA